MAIHIPDSNFLAALVQMLPAECFDSNGKLVDVSSVTELTLFDRNLASLEGIQYFENLVVLDCSYNQLTSLPSCLQN